MILTTRPISDRTLFTGKHQASKFTVSYAQTLDLLDTELNMLKARDIVLELDVTEAQIKLDGQVRAGARAASPAVRLAFETEEHGSLIFGTDRFVRGDTWAYVGPIPQQGQRRRRNTMEQDWQHNLYAIAKGMEAARLMERYGITSLDQQYTGFKAIGGGRAMPASSMTMTDAEEVLFRAAGLTHHEALGMDWSSVIKKARTRSHPDLNDGDRSQFNLVDEAAQLVEHRGRKVVS